MTRSWFSIVAAASLLLAVSACHGSKSTSLIGTTPTATPVPSATPTVTLRGPGTGAVAPLVVTSAAFTNGGTMPAVAAFTGCGGSNTSPDFSWSGAPATTKSFVITMFDPDAPTGVGFWHWLLYNIPPGITSIASGAGTSPPSGTSGLNDYGAVGYGGPCPPAGDGTHHYNVTVSALDIVLTGMPANTTGAYLTFNMRGHIVAQGAYVGLYSR
jgi:Raf kinase inhibitor-like YbhB/YbcL family protein